VRNGAYGVLVAARGDGWIVLCCLVLSCLVLRVGHAVWPAPHALACFVPIATSSVVLTAHWSVLCLDPGLTCEEWRGPGVGTSVYYCCLCRGHPGAGRSCIGF
jgi:hypothetical protein